MSSPLLGGSFAFDTWSFVGVDEGGGCSQQPLHYFFFSPSIEFESRGVAACKKRKALPAFFFFGRVAKRKEKMYAAVRPGAHNQHRRPLALMLTFYVCRVFLCTIHRLEGAKDWAVSRNRFWGTPMPMWVSDDGEEMVAVGSIAELKELSGVEVSLTHERCNLNLMVAIDVSRPRYAGENRPRGCPVSR